MTFFYDLNKRLADLAKKQTLAEDKGSKPDFLDLDKDGNKKESMKKAVADKDGVDESALQAFIGKKKYGDSGMKALQQAGRDGASKEKMAKIRAQHDKMDEAESGDVIDAQSETMLIRALRAQGLNDKQIVRRIEQIMRGKAVDPRQGAQKTMAKEGDMDEGNEFSGELVKARAQGAKEFKVDGKSYPVKEGGMPMTPKQKSFAKLAPPADKITFADKIAGAKKEVDEMLGDVAAEAIKSAIGKKKEPRSKGTAFDPEVLKTMTATDPHPRYDVKDTGYSKRYTRKVQDEPQDDDAPVDTGPKKKGRPLSAAPKDSERVTKGSHKYQTVNGKRVKKEKTAEDLDTDGVMMNKPSNMSSESVDSGEYDREGDMAKEQMHTIMSAAKELHGILKDDENLPEWVQKKITLAKEYIDTARDYMLTQHAERDEEQPIAEKAVSKKQQRFMGMVHAAQKGEKPASKEVAKTAKGMGKKDAKDFAATKHKGLPEKAKAKKKEKDVDESTTTSGSVAPAAAPAKAGKGGYNFGGGVYESLDRKFRTALNEGMNVSVNMSTGQDGEPTKNITISADGEDADRLADLLKMAGLGGQQGCNTCGSSPCGCASLDENSPDYPTNTQTSDNAMQYSGGLNGPKSTGQSTTPVLASQLNRQVSMEESVKIEQSLFKLYNQYKLK